MVSNQIIFPKTREWESFVIFIKATITIEFGTRVASFGGDGVMANLTLLGY